MQATTLSSIQTFHKHNCGSKSSDNNQSENVVRALSPKRKISPNAPEQGLAHSLNTSNQMAPRQIPHITFTEPETNSLTSRDIEILGMLSETLAIPTKKWGFLVHEGVECLHSRFLEIVEYVLCDQISDPSQNKRKTQLKQCLDKLFQPERMGWEFVYQNLPTNLKVQGRINDRVSSSSVLCQHFHYFSIT